MLWNYCHFSTSRRAEQDAAVFLDRWPKSDLYTRAIGFVDFFILMLKFRFYLR